jgi:hypothetical protein
MAVDSYCSARSRVQPRRCSHPKPANLRVAHATTQPQRRWLLREIARNSTPPTTETNGAASANIHNQRAAVFITGDLLPGGEPTTSRLRSGGSVTQRKKVAGVVAEFDESIQAGRPRRVGNLHVHEASPPAPDALGQRRGVAAGSRPSRSLRLRLGGAAARRPGPLTGSRPCCVSRRRRVCWPTAHSGTGKRPCAPRGRRS